MHKCQAIFNIFSQVSLEALVIAHIKVAHDKKIMKVKKPETTTKTVFSVGFYCYLFLNVTSDKTHISFINTTEELTNVNTEKEKKS